MLPQSSRSQLVGRGVVLALAVTGSLAALAAITPTAAAQTDVPDAPTAVAVYSIETQKLEVRWSTSDAANTTSFKIQWKSGSEEFDSSRHMTSDPATSIESDQSTSAGDRYVDIITGLTDGTEYTVRVVASNSNGDSDASTEATGTPQSSPGQVKEFVENEVVEIFESSYPWLRETWDYVAEQNVRVAFTPHAGGSAGVFCSPTRPMESNLRKCDTTALSFGRYAPFLIRVIVHELAHAFTLANRVAATPAPLGIAFLYFYDLPPGSQRSALCDPKELYADALTVLTFGTDWPSENRGYWAVCPHTPDEVSDEALGVVRSASTGQMPSWFADTYNDSGGDPDLERVWRDLKQMPESWRAAAVFQLRDAFGGYCDNQKATASAFLTGLTRNPWNDGGCVPEAPGSPSATAVGDGKLAVSWTPPGGDGGSPIGGYKVQWKSGAEEYDASRQANVPDPMTTLATITGLTNGTEYTLRVLAYNHNGDGASAATTATPAAADTTSPALRAARVDGATLVLTWNEALDEGSRPVASAFTVNVAGATRGVDQVAVSGGAVTLTLSSSVHVGEVVTVGYAVPTGSSANPLRDTAENNAAGFSGQAVRNDATAVAISSDPGSDMTYIFGHGFGREDGIEVTVTYGESVRVSGVPQLTLQIGDALRDARYQSGSGTTALTFRYTVTEAKPTPTASASRPETSRPPTAPSGTSPRAPGRRRAWSWTRSPATGWMPCVRCWSQRRQLPPATRWRSPGIRRWRRTPRRRRMSAASICMIGPAARIATSAVSR